jgi:repressor LexA
MAKLTAKQKLILSYIENYHKEKGYPPTLREICKKFEIASTNGARYHLHRLKDLGYIEIDPHKSRGVKCVGMDVEPETNVAHKRSYLLPVLGQVPAGPFDLASEDLREDVLTVDPEFFGTRSEEPDLFGLRVKGDSMLNEGIHDGDIVIVRPQAQANNGDIVVARVDEEATVKRFKRMPEEVVLEPANPRYEPIRIPNQGGVEQGQDLSLVGIVVGLIRSM